MIRSMTGFGRGNAQAGTAQITIDIRSVNHRYMDLIIRQPKQFGELEAEIRNIVKASLSRGRVEIFINRLVDEANATNMVFNKNVADAFTKNAKELAKKLKLADDLRIETVLAQKGVVEYQDAPPDFELEKKALFKALNQALQAVVRMQKVEGKAMRKDLQTRLKKIEDHRKAIKKHVPEIRDAIIQRLRERIQEIAGDVNLDEGRLAQEVAYQAGRGDITEEVVRLQSHIVQLKALLSVEKPIGRKMDFLLQEANREISTIGAKINSGDVAGLVIEVKSELEKVREQTQNIE